MAKSNEDKMLSAFMSMASNAASASNNQIVDATSLSKQYISPDKGLSTGVLSLDYVMRGGLPNGRFHQVYGPSMAGKTTLITRTMGMAQSFNRPIIHLDAEFAADINYMLHLGLDMKGDGYVYTQPTTGDSGFRFIKRMLTEWYETYGNEIPGPLVTIDSFKAMTPEAFMDDDTKTPMALQARMFSTWISPVKALIGQTDGILLGVNQIRNNPGAMFGNPETIPGGEALTFFSDSIIRLSRVGKVEETDWGNAQIQRCNFKKLKHATPGSSLDLRIVQGIGYDPTDDIWTMLSECGVGQTYPGGWYTLEPYEGLPELPEGVEPEKKYRWNELVQFMIPKVGQHYAQNELYQWCYNIIATGAIFKAVDEYNASTASDEGVGNVSSSAVAFDYTQLHGATSPEKFKEIAQVNESLGITEVEDGAAKTQSLEVELKDNQYRLSDYPEDQIEPFIGQLLVSDFYEDGTLWECTMTAKVGKKKAKVTWTEDGSSETVPLHKLIYTDGK